MQKIYLVAHHFDEGLDNSCSVIVHTDFNNGRDNGVDNLLQIIDGADVDDSLTKIVSKLIHHTVWEQFQHTLNQLGNKGSSVIHLVNLLLDHAASGLVKGKELYVANDFALIV